MILAGFLDWWGKSEHLLQDDKSLQMRILNIKPEWAYFAAGGIGSLLLLILIAYCLWGRSRPKL
jgi:hypothetical protein